MGRLTCLLALLCLATPARAESGVAMPIDPSAHVRRPTVPIPSDGVVLLESDDFSVPVIEVRDASGALIEGVLREVGIATGPLYAWIPASPLALGTLEVTLGNQANPDVAKLVTIEVVAPFEAWPPALRSDPSATWQATPQEQACCSAPFGRTGNCFFTTQECVIRVEPGFSSPASQAVLNQYLFRVAEAGTDANAESPLFRPLESAHEAVFLAPADQYCIEIHALDLATQQVHVYADLERCASHDNDQVGPSVAVELDPRDLAIEGCLVPPFGYEDRWCEINRGACDGGSSEGCQLVAYVCDGGPLPAGWQAMTDGGMGGDDALDGGSRDAGDAGLPASDPIDASFGPSARADGCSVTHVRARAHRQLALGPALVLALLALRIKRRSATARVPSARLLVALVDNRACSLVHRRHAARAAGSIRKVDLHVHPELPQGRRPGGHPDLDHPDRRQALLLHRRPHVQGQAPA